MEAGASHALDLEAIEPVHAADVACAGSRAVGAKNQDRAIGVLLDEGAAGLASLLGIGVKRAEPFRMRAMDGVMHQVAGDNGFLPLGRNSHADRKSTRLNSSHQKISYA